MASYQEQEKDVIAQDYQDLMKMNGVKILRIYDYLDDKKSQKEIKQNGYNMQSLSRKFNMTNEDAQVIFKYVCKFSKENQNEKVCDILFNINEKMINTTVSASTKKRQKLIEEYTHDSRLKKVLELKFEEKQEKIKIDQDNKIPKSENIELDQLLQDVDVEEKIEIKQELQKDKSIKSKKKYLVFALIVFILIGLVLGLKSLSEYQFNDSQEVKNISLKPLPTPNNIKVKPIKSEEELKVSKTDKKPIKDTQIPKVDLSKIEDNKDKPIKNKNIFSDEIVEKVLEKEVTKKNINTLLKNFNEITKSLQNNEILINEDKTITFKNEIYKVGDRFEEKYVIQRITTKSIKLLNTKQKYSKTIRR